MFDTKRFVPFFACKRLYNRIITLYRLINIRNNSLCWMHLYQVKTSFVGFCCESKRSVIKMTNRSTTKLISGSTFTNIDQLRLWHWWVMIYIEVVHSCPNFRDGLTHWGRDKMAAISQTTFSNAFSWMKTNEFRLRFHWSLFLRVQLTIFQHWFG